MNLTIKKQTFKAPELYYVADFDNDDYYCVYYGKQMLSMYHFKNNKKGKELLERLGSSSTIDFIFRNYEDAESAVTMVGLLGDELC